MKNIVYIICGFILFSCSEDKLKFYNGPVSLYFNIEQNASYVDTLSFGFGEIDAFEYVYPIKLRATGKVATHDRPFSVRISDTVNAQIGTDFEIAGDPVFPADSTEAILYVKLYRGPEGDTLQRFVTFHIEPNEYFDTELKYRIHKNHPKDTVDVTKITLSFTSLMTAPARWRTQAFGYFSVAKYILVNQLNGITKDDWPTVSAQTGLAWGGVLENYLIEKALHGHESAIKDPNPNSRRGYMTMSGRSSDKMTAMIPVFATEEWPDYPQN